MTDDIFSGGIPAFTEQQQKEAEEWLKKLDEAEKKYKTALEIAKERNDPGRDRTSAWNAQGCDPGLCTGN